MPPSATFDEYLESLGRLTAHADPTVITPETLEITDAAVSLGLLPEITDESLAQWVSEQPSRARVLGLAVGLSQEKLKNALKHHLGTTGLAHPCQGTSRRLGGDAG